jgi:hypothetical protein
MEQPDGGLAAHTGQTDIRVTARADDEAEADELIANVEAIIRERVGEYIYGTGTEPLEDMFVNLLREKGLKLALSYNGPEELAVTKRFSHEDVIVKKEFDSDLGALLARSGLADSDPSTLDYGELACAEARRLMESSDADVAIAYVTHEQGTGITAMTRDRERTRRYAFGGASTDAPAWAGTWGISMAWHLVRRIEDD